MNAPDQRLFEADLEGASFLIGASKGHWGLTAPEILPAGLAWPKRILWLAAPPRPNAPDKFHLLLDLTGYRAASPTGAFWDPATKVALATEKWPKGSYGGRFAKVFRTDWEGARAFYHPFDRFAASSHPQWPTEQPHLIWTSERTIVDFLAEFHELFHGGGYVGI